MWFDGQVTSLRRQQTYTDSAEFTLTPRNGDRPFTFVQRGTIAAVLSECVQLKDDIHLVETDLHIDASSGAVQGNISDPMHVLVNGKRVPFSYISDIVHRFVCVYVCVFSHTHY